jgi:hypothetical protein
MSGYGVYVWGAEGSVYRGQVGGWGGGGIAGGCGALAPARLRWSRSPRQPLGTQAHLPLCTRLPLTHPQWRDSMMEGCGVKITRQPSGAFLAEEGQFVRDEWVSGGVKAGQERRERCR